MKLNVDIEVTPKALEIDPLRETPLVPTAREIDISLHVLGRQIGYSATYKEPLPKTGTFDNFEGTLKVTWSIE